MRAFLNAFLSSIDTGQRDAIIGVLDRLRREGQIRTEEEFDFELAKLIKAVKAGRNFKPSFIAPDKDRGITSSEELNDAFRDIHVDLAGAFKQSSMAAATIVRHDAFTIDSLKQAEDGLRKLLCDIRIYQFLKSNPDFTDVRFVDFSAGQVARNAFSGPIAAQIDPETSVLRLRERTRQQIEGRRGIMTPTVTVDVLSTGLSSSSQGFGASNAINPRRDTFWAEVLLSDSPIRTSYKSTEYDGALVQVTVDLARTEFANEIAIKPFAEFPLRVIDIEVKEGKGSFQTVDGFSVSDFGLDWIESRVNRQEVSSVRVTLQQPSFNDKVFLIRRSQLSHALLWDQIIQATLRQGLDRELLSDELLGQADLDDNFIRRINGLQRFSEEIKKSNLGTEFEANQQLKEYFTAISRVVAEIDPKSQKLTLQQFGTDSAPDLDDPFIEMHKVEYLLGAFNIRIADIGFEPFSIYRSPRFRAPSTLAEVSLTVQENHTLVDGNQVSTTEYEIEVGKNKRIPIVPNGTTRVQEFVFVDDRTLTGKLRFVSTTPNAVLTANGIAVLASTYTITGRTLTLSSGFRRSNRYVLSYDIDLGQDSANIQSLFDSTPINTPEVFSGTKENGTLQLRSVPFVALEIINRSDGEDASWIKADPFGAVYIYRTDKQPIVVDGVPYGFASGALSASISKTATSFAVTGGAVFPSSGVLEIFDSISKETLAYDTFAGGTFSQVKRGQSGTTSKAWASGSTLKLLSKTQYEPLKVIVDGVKARNITDYLSGEHPAFVAPDPRRREFSYLQIGRTLYFSDRIENRRIEVEYNVLAEYVRLNIVLRCNTPVIHPVTPTLSEYSLRIK